VVAETFTDTDSLNPHGPLRPASADLAYPLSYMMRTEVGQGPLELLALRGFVLPARIFMNAGPGTVVAADGSTTGNATRSTTPAVPTADFPPVPQALLDGLKQARMQAEGVPLPGLLPGNPGAL
jgi:type VI secretion system protein ImpL